MGPMSADAACAPVDLAGEWDAYSVGATTGEGVWNRCNVSFNSSARFLSGSSCRTDSGARSTLSGQLSVDSSCRVTGRFTERFRGGTNTCSIPQATLSRDKEVVTGVGKCANGAGIFSFNMVKR